MVISVIGVIFAAWLAGFIVGWLISLPSRAKMLKRNPDYGLSLQAIDWATAVMLSIAASGIVGAATAILVIIGGIVSWIFSLPAVPELLPEAFVGSMVFIASAFVARFVLNYRTKEKKP
jgi:hypothetical protein